MKKQHQLDRDRSSGYHEITLCGREMSRDHEWAAESCEQCARVARAREDARTRAELAKLKEAK